MTLLHQHNKFMKAKESREELVRDNELNLVQGSNASVDGPFKFMSQARIDCVHQEITDRLEELEESGLSRNEILYDDPHSGIPLKDDPFFQLIKSSNTVREMLIGPNEEFSADRVIEKALRQDVGPDPSLSTRRDDFRYMDAEEDALGPTWEYKKKFRDRTPLYGPEAVYAGHNSLERGQRMLEFEKDKPATFINRPLTRNQIRKKLMRSVSKKDIDFRNTQLMTKFLNPAGKIYNRWQSRLDTPV